MRSMPVVSRAVRLLVVSLLSSLPLSAQNGPPVREMLRFVDASSATEQAVEIELSALRESRVLLPLLDGRTVVVNRTDLEVRGPGDSTWRGRIAGPSGEPAGDVVLTVRGGRVLGSVMVPGAAWRISPAEGGRHQMRELDERAVLERYEIDGRMPLATLVERETEDIPPLLRAPADRNTPISRFNAIALYTAAARQAAGGHEAIRQQLQHQVDFANTAYINSKIQMRLEMPYVEEAPLSDLPETSFRNLLWIQHDPGVIALQRRYGAAFSVLVTETGAGCGVAGSILRPDEYRDRRVTMQGGVVLRRPCLENLNFLLAHEIGHTLGCEHDPAWGSPVQSALFPYAFGYFVDGNFRTVMSYPNECRLGCPSALHFSNPAIRFNGLPTGIPGQRDNARVINATRTRFGPPPASQRCQPGLNTLCLGGRRFKVQVDWYNQFNENDGVARAIQRTDSSGFLTFGDPSNIELMVKALDFGNTVKLFYGQLTNLSFRMIVTDTKTGAFKVYGNTPGDCGGIDQNAFPGGAVAAASTGAAATAGCRSGTQTLCLKNRFQVTATWRNPANGQSGQAGAVPLSQVTGAFYFSGPDSLELMTKVVEQGNRVDFFYGTLSDLEYTISVTDTRTGAVKSYRNNAGRYCGGLEVNAF